MLLPPAFRKPGVSDISTRIDNALRGNISVSVTPEQVDDIVVHLLKGGVNPDEIEAAKQLLAGIPAHLAADQQSYEKALERGDQAGASLADRTVREDEARQQAYSRILRALQASSFSMAVRRF